MGDVHCMATPRRQGNVARDNDLFSGRGDAAQPQPRGHLALVHAPAPGQVRILAVGNHRQVESGGILQPQAHHLGVGDRMAVIRQCHAPGVTQVAGLGQFAALQAASQRADRHHLDHPLGGRLLAYRTRHCGAIIDRPRVGHTGHGGKAAGSRGSRTGGDRFLVLLAGLAQMHMHIDQARTHHEPTRIQHLARAFSRQLRGDRRNATPVNQHIRLPVTTGIGIEHPAAFNQYPHHVPTG